MLLQEFYLWLIHGQFTVIYVQREENTKRSSPPEGAKGNCHELAKNIHELQLLLQYPLYLFGCGVNSKDGSVAVYKHGDASSSANAIFLPNLMFIM